MDNRHKKYTDNKFNVFCLQHKTKLKYNKKVSGYPCVKCRLEDLKETIEAENISYSEIAELQSLKKYINKDDVLLLQWAGVPESI